MSFSSRGSDDSPRETRSAFETRGYPGNTARGQQDLTAFQAWCLYLSHFLSMWNSRAYEYGAVLFTQAVFPGSLLPSSLYGIAETVCVLVSSSALGRWVDHSPNRLRPLLFSIVTNRVTIVMCCSTWIFMFLIDDETLKRLTFGLLLLMGMIVKVSRMSNMLSMERDWIPTVAKYPSINGQDLTKPAYDLTHLNTVIRRIDIACKFLAPVAISGTMAWIDAKPTALVLALMSGVGVFVEVSGLMAVWKRNARLATAKHRVQDPAPSEDPDSPISCLGKCAMVINGFERLTIMQIEGIRYYFSANVCLPSVGIAVLHASVLDWSGTLITWLLNSGFSYLEITAAKAVGSVFEVGSTFIFPVLVGHYARRAAGSSSNTYQMVSSKDDADDSMEEDDAPAATRRDELPEPIESTRTYSSLDPIVRAGHAGVSELLSCLCPAVFCLFFLDSAFEASSGANGGDSTVGTAFSRTPVLSIVFFAFLSFSFLGRWIYDLSVTQLTQVMIPASHRSQFGGAEMAMVAGIGMLHWIAAAIWHDQSDYKWLSVGSLGAVAVAFGLWYRWRVRWIRQQILAPGV